jgi:CDP-diacylglycerol--glycerol-3-phosphate 3-phosphatidyltransferase
MPLNIPNLLTLARIMVIPVFVIVYYLPVPWSALAATVLFIFAGVTDWLDGYLARRLQQQSPFGAFLDPVADKLMVATAIVLLVGDDRVQDQVISPILFTVMAAIIIGREIGVSALREWMGEMGNRASVAVSIVGKVKTVMQMVAVSMLLYAKPLAGISMAGLGEMLFYVAGALTLWSMIVYLRAAWDDLVRAEQKAGPT